MLDRALPGFGVDVFLVPGKELSIVFVRFGQKARDGLSPEVSDFCRAVSLERHPLGQQRRRRTNDGAE
ncbi:hypothetical protein JKJ07_26935 [Actinoplanes sp. LDG1-01]|uniref:Uncharacterized protein n=1 Tax=Paractinoplanes lichenicola TaxID=2802976 RepID=A0ABS1VTY2_9ACTN|nr:hypothetical protein [Actinoplanes lichenicola]